MTRTLRIAGITAIALALVGAITISARAEAPTAAGPRLAHVAPDPGGGGVDAVTVEVEPAGWARGDSRRAQPNGGRIDSVLAASAGLAVVLLALGAVSAASRRARVCGGRTGFRRRAPPLLASV